MSLKTIKEVVRRAIAGIPTSGEMGEQAMAEIETLETACQDIVAFGSVEHASHDTEENAAVDAAVALFAAIAKEAE